MTQETNAQIILQIKDLVKIYAPDNTRLSALVNILPKAWRKNHRQNQSVRALDSVTLSIHKGEILALLGVNGAGKTTLSSIIATLNPPTSGNIFFKGASIYNNLSLYRSALGYCPQRPNLDYELNVEENLYFAGRYFLVPEEILSARVADLMKQFDLVKYAKFNAKELSGGYKQRLLIARALIHKPEIVILDEPTIALDPSIRRQLWDKILELKGMGITVILTTHYLEEAEILSDRVCILDAGKILLIDKSQNLKQRFNMPNLEAVFLHLTQEESH